MSAFVMISVGTVVAMFHVSNIHGMILDSDIENILSQPHNKGFSLQHSPLDESLERGESSDYIQQFETIARTPQVQIGFPYKDKDLLYDKDPRNKHGRYSYWPWRQNLYVKPAWLKSVNTPRKQNYPLNDKKEDGKNDLGDYSKVYLILDLDSGITETDVRDLSNKVASLLTKSRAPRKSWLKDRIQKEQRYKGFVIKDNRRRRLDSKEEFAEGDSIEHNKYKPKRARVDYGGAGGGGRTPIPYIRQRGDIFERE